jgi:hypothetical protein
MPTTLLALQLLLILLPGFAAAYVVQTLAVRGSQTDFDKVIEAALYSVLIYGLFTVFTWGALPFSIVPAKAGVDATIQWSPGKLLLLLAATLLVSIASVAWINKDGNRLLRRTGLTTRTTRRSVWNDIFESEAGNEQAVQVELENNRSLIGVLAYWSDSADDGSLYIVKAKWVSQDGTETPVHGPGVLLTKESNVKSISLLDPPSGTTEQPEETRADEDVATS